MRISESPSQRNMNEILTLPILRISKRNLFEDVELLQNNCCECNIRLQLLLLFNALNSLPFKFNCEKWLNEEQWRGIPGKTWPTFAVNIVLMFVHYPASIIFSYFVICWWNSVPLVDITANQLSQKLIWKSHVMKRSEFGETFSSTNLHAQNNGHWILSMMWHPIIYIRTCAACAE